MDLVATSTALAGAGGAIAAAIYMTLTTRRPDPTLVANGLLAGLVASSASAGLIGPNVGFLIGVASGLLVCLAVNWLDKLHVDDPVGAIAVHGLGGLWGVLAAGLFAHGSLGAAGNVRQVVRGDVGQVFIQLLGCVALLVWGFGVSWVFFKVLPQGSGAWQHVTLEGSGINPPGYATGTGTEIEVVVPPDCLGLFVRRCKEGRGPLSVQNVKAVWTLSSNSLVRAETVRIIAQKAVDFILDRRADIEEAA